jgi:hypothetical protein
MVEAMVQFDLRHPGHRPWESLIREVRKQLLLAQSGSP